jgi:VanZ family protein
LESSQEQRRTAGYWVRTWLPVVLAICVIAVESTTYLGADHTSGPLRWIYEHLFGTVDDDQWGDIHHIIRKCGHFVGYGLVALTWLRAWWMTLPRAGFFKDALLAMVGTFLVAASDEFHQSFLPNRTSSPWDVLLDCCGAIVMQLVVFLFLRVTSRSWQRRPV